MPGTHWVSISYFKKYWDGRYIFLIYGAYTNISYFCDLGVFPFISVFFLFVCVLGTNGIESDDWTDRVVDQPRTGTLGPGLLELNCASQANPKGTYFLFSISATP